MPGPREIKLSSVRKPRHKNRKPRANSHELAAQPSSPGPVFHRNVELVPIGRLTPAARNARTHPKKQIRQIANSILQFGWTYPILTDEHHRIIAGFGRYKAAELLGFSEVSISVISGLSQAQKRALALADNKLALNAGWDRSVLAAELGELADLLPEFNLDMEITGFEPAEIDSLMGDLVDPEQDPVDQLPEIAKVAVSRSGDGWRLGQHRLLCGDARAAPDLRKLMGREYATMVKHTRDDVARRAELVGLVHDEQRQRRGDDVADDGKEPDQRIEAEAHARTGYDERGVGCQIERASRSFSLMARPWRRQRHAELRPAAPSPLRRQRVPLRLRPCRRRCSQSP